MTALLRHWISAAVFITVLVLNHKLGLELSFDELALLSFVLGVGNVVSIIQAIRSPNVATSPKPADPPVDVAA